MADDKKKQICGCCCEPINSPSSAAIFHPGVLRGTICHEKCLLDRFRTRACKYCARPIGPTDQIVRRNAEGCEPEYSHSACWALNFERKPGDYIKPVKTEADDP